MAIIKFCDRDDTGKYVLTVKNASGTKTAEVNVKVLGEYAKQPQHKQTRPIVLNVPFIQYPFFFYKIHLDPVGRLQ